MATSSPDNDLRASVRSIPDYPKPGIMFRDITTLLGDARAFRRAVDELVQPWAGMKIDKVAGIEARGFILGGAVAHQVSAGFVPIRKKGKLPHKRVSVAYALEYGEDTIEMHADALVAGERVVLVDDLIATGGTAEAAVKLLRQLGANVLAACFVIDLPELGGADAPAQARRAGAHADFVRGALSFRFLAGIAAQTVRQILPNGRPFGRNDAVDHCVAHRSVMANLMIADNSIQFGAESFYAAATRSIEKMRAKFDRDAIEAFEGMRQQKQLAFCIERAALYAPRVPSRSDLDAAVGCIDVHVGRHSDDDARRIENGERQHRSRRLECKPAVDFLGHPVGRGNRGVPEAPEFAVLDGVDQSHAMGVCERLKPDVGAFKDDRLRPRHSINPSVDASLRFRPPRPSRTGRSRLRTPGA